MRNFDTPRSEAYFVQATSVPRTCYGADTFHQRVSHVSVFVRNFSFVCMAYQGVCVLLTCDVCMAMKRACYVSTAMSLFCVL